MKNKQAKINYADLWGLREEKYKFLDKNDSSTTKWQSITPIEPFFFLTVKDFTGAETYESFILLDKIFRNFTAGVVSGKDDVLTDEKFENLRNKIITIFNSSQTKESVRLAYDLNNSAGNKILSERQNLQFEESKLKKYHYRPLDYRYIYYETSLLERHRSYLASSMCKQNLAISVSRLTVNKSFSNVIASDCLADYKLAESSRGSYFFPLYIYKENASNTLFESGLADKKESNFKVELIALLNQTHNPQPVITPLNQQKTFDILPEQIFYYIYAILYSNVYRKKYQEFLKIDFPRIPFTKDYDLFKKLAELGRQLVNLHLLKSLELNNPISKFHGNNGNRVEKREYNEKEKRIYINSQQYFENIGLEVWNYYIGGYQVLDKWLKDRKGSMLSAEDIKHYCKVITALSETIETQKIIDKLYPEVEKNLIK